MDLFSNELSLGAKRTTTEKPPVPFSTLDVLKENHSDIGE